MIQHELEQGSNEWHQHRAKYFNASDAPAMMGLSSYKSRTELLKELKTGIAPEVDDATLARFNDGHRFEALARPLAEEIIGEELYPVVGSDGKLSASFDGLTMMGDVNFEHKTLNNSLRGVNSIEELPEMYKVQMEQQMLVSGAEKSLFMASLWDASNNLIEEKHFWYESDLELRQRIIDGWAQFERDLETFGPVVVIEKPVAEPTESLPAVSIRVDGGLAVISNLDLFGAKLREFVGNLTKDPQDDQDFANLEQAVKDLKKAEDALESAENMALAQIVDVNDMRRTVADLREIARSHRLTSEKLVKSQKEVIKLKILADVKDKFASHVSGLQSEIKGVRLEVSTPDFAGSMKNKRTIASLHDAVNTLLAGAMVDADRVAKDVREKLAWCKETSNGYGFLFNDLQTLIQKPREDFELAVTSRIKEHQEQERIKADQAAKEQAEREARLVKEAEERAAREAEAKIRAEQEAKAKAEEEKRLADEREALDALRAERESKTVTPESLRADAAHIAMCAEHADRNEDRRRELQQAAELRKQADRLEQEEREKIVSQAIQQVEERQAELKADSQKVKPATFRHKAINALMGYYDTDYDTIESWLIAEFSNSEAREAA